MEVDEEGAELVWDAKLGMYRAPAAAVAKSESEMSWSERAAALNKRLQEDPRDVQLWLDFVRIQVRIILLNHLNGLGKWRLWQDRVAGEQWQRGGRRRGEEEKEAKAASDRQLLERKLAILDRAAAANPKAFPLKLERIVVGGEGLWDRQRLR